MESQIVFSQNYLQNHLIDIKIKPIILIGSINLIKSQFKKLGFKLTLNLIKLTSNPTKNILKTIKLTL